MPRPRRAESGGDATPRHDAGADRRGAAGAADRGHRAHPHEHTPGPGAFDPASLATGTPRFVATGDPDDVPRGKLTSTTVRTAPAEIAAQREDPHLHHLDGTELYGAADAETHPLPDALHPDTATHRIIGTRFAEYLGRL